MMVLGLGVWGDVRLGLGLDVLGLLRITRAGGGS